MRQNFTLAGAFCPPFTQTTQITGNLTIGSSGFLSTRMRVSHMKFEGNLIFDNSTNQQLRTYFYNCDWNGTITFPTSAATGTSGTAIYFDNCSFSGASAIVIPNQSLYTIFFTRCAFIGQTITNNQVVGNTTKLIFTDCSYLPTLTTLGFCILNGLNTTLTTTQANFGSVVLGGTATSLLKGNGTTVSGTINQFALGNGSLTTSNSASIMKGDATTLSGAGFVKGDATLDNTIYPTLTAESNFTTTFTSGGASSGSIVIAVRKISNGTNSIIHLFLPPIVFTTGAGGGNCTSSTALVAGLRPLNANGTLGYNLSVVSVRVGATYVAGLISVNPTGTITIGADLSTGASSNPAGNITYGLWNQTTITYIGA